MTHFKNRLMVIIVTGVAGISGVPAGGATLTLEAALAKASSVHPELRGVAVRERLLAIEAKQAALRPPVEAGVEVENLGTEDVETTFTLAGVLEFGNKRAARQALAALRLDELGIEREIKAPDVLAEVNRRYLDLAERQARLPLLEQALERQQALARAVRRRYGEGASPEALALSAEAEVARRQAERTNATRDIEMAWRALALMWDEREPGLAPTTAARANTLPALQPLESVRTALKNSPDLRYFAQADRVQEARQRLAAASRSIDLRWQVGVRRFDLTNDDALVAAVSVPLGQGRRAALAESFEAGSRELISTSRDASALALESTLVRVYGELVSSLEKLEILGREVFPKVSTAAVQAARAYAAGAITYHESMQIQNEATQLEWERLALRFAIDRQLVELQRLTGNPIISVEDKP